MKHAVFLIVGLTISVLLAVVGVLAYQGGIPLLVPSGPIGGAERDLMINTTLLMLIVIIPVYILITLIAIRYRARPDNTAEYTPDWAHSRLEEFVWWTIPMEIILVLAAITWNATHALAPERPLESIGEAYTVQVVALPWKWLFIYPDSHIATVNELVIPAGKPIDFVITADAPMNSFWIPALGGQMYAMSGMMTHLHLVASTTGSYTGMSANYSGEGFGEMHFPVRSMTMSDFEDWKTSVSSSTNELSETSYAELSKPSSGDPVRYYGSITFSFMDIVHESMEVAPH